MNRVNTFVALSQLETRGLDGPRYGLVVDGDSDRLKSKPRFADVDQVESRRFIAELPL